MAGETKDLSPSPTSEKKASDQVSRDQSGEEMKLLSRLHPDPKLVCDNPPHDQKTQTFKTLSREIRGLIYDYVLEDFRNIKVPNYGYDTAFDMLSLSILLLDKETSQEAREALAQQTKFRIRGDDQAGDLNDAERNALVNFPRLLFQVLPDSRHFEHLSESLRIFMQASTASQWQGKARFATISLDFLHSCEFLIRKSLELILGLAADPVTTWTIVDLPTKEQLAKHYRDDHARLLEACKPYMNPDFESNSIAWDVEWYGHEERIQAIPIGVD